MISRQTIEEKLVECSSQVLELLGTGDVENLPNSSLKLRQLISAVEKKYGQEDNNIPIGKVLTKSQNVLIVQQALKAFNNFRDALGQINSNNNPAELTIADGILEIEKRIPMLWDPKLDLLFIEETHKIRNVFVDALIKYGQKNIFTFSGDWVTDELSNEKFNINDGYKFFFRADKVFGLRSEFVFRSKDAVNPKFEKAITDILKHVHSNTATTIGFQKLWYDNQKETFLKRINNLSHEHLRPYFKNRNVLIVAPGPSLARSIEIIQKEGNKYFTIVAAAQSMNALTQYGICPHFLVVVDPKDFSFILADYENLNSINLIIDDSTHYNFFEYDFKNIFSIITKKDSFGLQEAFGVDLFNEAGGTVTLTAAFLAAELQAQSITLVGQDLAVSSGDYFISTKADQHKLEEKDGAFFITSIGHTMGAGVREAIPVAGWNNETLYTIPEYYNYLTAFSNFSKKVSNVSLNNCSVGGAYIRGFNHVELEYVIETLEINPVSIDTINGDYPLYMQNAKNTLQKSIKITGKAIDKIKRLKVILSSRNSAQEKSLKKIDKIEHDLMSIVEAHPKLKSTMLDHTIEYKEKLAGVDFIEENLQLSQLLYSDIYERFIQYRKDCKSLLRELSD